MITLEMLEKRWPNGDQHIAGLREGIIAAAPDVFQKYGLTKPIAIAHFMAQASEECGQGLEMTESLNYTATRLRQVWPSHFTATMAQRWAHNEKMIGEIAYGGRMGNGKPPSTDGYDFRGRGMTQVTGRDGYSALQKTLDNGWDLLTNPDLIIDPEYTLECGVADWINCGCLAPAMADDIITETKRLNGGTNGLAERKRQLRLWKTELGL